jgi:hypothetical protein
MSKGHLLLLGGVFVFALLITGTTAAQEQDVEVTCFWVGQRLTCHTWINGKKWRAYGAIATRRQRPAADKSKLGAGEPKLCTGPQEAQN